MSDERFERLLQDAASHYNQPPETPRELMWERIQVARNAPTPLPVRRWRPKTWLAWGTGIAAILAVGIGIGRLGFSAPDPAPPLGELAVNGVEEGEQLVFQVAAADHLQQTDAFLSLFRTEATSGRADGEVERWGRELLTTTRFMIDSPAADDPTLRELLEDLELVLVQITQYTDADGDAELALIEDGLNESDVQLRMRTVLTTNEDGFLVRGDM